MSAGYHLDDDPGGGVLVTYTTASGGTGSFAVRPERIALLRKLDREQARQPGRIGLTEQERYQLGQAAATLLAESTGRGKGGWYRLTALGADVVAYAEEQS